MLNGRPIWATIPTIGYSELLIPLVNQLEDDTNVDRILLTVNLEEYVEPVREFFRFGEPNIDIVETWCLGRSLHHGWNTAIQMARQANAWLAVLNDDIKLLEPKAVSSVVEVMDAHPSYAVVGMNYFEGPEQTKPTATDVRPVHGSYRHHGVGGFAWVCDPHKVKLVPDTLVWWGGDDFCFLSAEQDGYKVGIANHVHVTHLSERTASEQDWTHEAREQDRIEFNRLFPGRSW